MNAANQDRRHAPRIKAQEDIFVQVNDCLCAVHDISLDGLAFDYQRQAATEIKASATLEIFFMSGPILYIENIPYTIVADIPLAEPNGTPSANRRRACARFDALTFRQVISFNHLLG
jgi:hypothetical protein